jgi:predicted pyridoxine 5'-phosphate oxidase superfamily flavin-nucleotide-binding protein
LDDGLVRSIGSRITDELADFIIKSKLLFIGSRSKDLDPMHAGGLDASHKAGKAGFIRIVDETTIEFDDFPGNNLFNTNGNVHEDGRTALAIVDFEQGLMVHLSATASIVWNNDHRSLRFKLHEIQSQPVKLGIRCGSHRIQQIGMVTAHA